MFESRLSESVMTDVEVILEDTGEQIESQIQERLSEYHNDLRFLHATPPVSGLHRSLNNAGINPLEHISNDFIRILDIEDQPTSYFALTQKIVVSGDIEQGYLLARLIELQSDVNNLEMGRRTSVYRFLVASQPYCYSYSVYLIEV
jgi:hypothetical protein